MRGLLLHVAVLLGLALWTAGASAAGPLSVQEAMGAYGRLSDDSAEARDPASWRKIGGALARVPTGATPEARESAAQTLYRAGLCFEKAFALSATPEDRAKAASIYDEVSNRFRASSVADDALLRGGRIAETRGTLPEARQRYERILSEHPDADLAPLAKRRLQELGQPSEITGVRSWSGPGYTRVVIDFSGSGVYGAGVLRENPSAGKPYRIFVDFSEARLAPACLGCLTVGDSLLRQVRSARFDPHTIRVVLDLESPASFRVFRLETPSRVVLDLFRKSGGVPAAKGGKPEKGPKREAAEDTLPPGGRSDASSAAQHRLRIVLDPGHGGTDPGAIGPNGAREKDVVLAIAKELGERLRSRVPCDIRFTRETDRTVSLEERTAIANAFGADLFVSIHANASRSAEARGTETYYLERASDRASRSVAARENASTDAGVSEIEHILADVLLSSKVVESKRLAESLQRSMVDGLRSDYSDVKDLGVKRAPFYVLTGAAMPAVLVETAFISHPEEVRRLEDPKYRARTADALARGLERFVSGTEVAGRRKGG